MANPNDEPMWTTGRIVAPTLDPTITIPKTANEFAIKGNHLTLVKENQFVSRNKTYPHKNIHEFLGVCDMFKYGATETEVVRLMISPITPGLANDLLDPFQAIPTTSSSPKPYQPPQARNEHVNAIFTRSGRSYDPPTNPNDSQNEKDSQTPIDLNSNDEDEEPTPQTKTPKPTKEAHVPKPYKPRIPHPQRLRKEKLEVQYGKFLDMIRAVRINVPLVDVLTGMPNYDKFLKELVSNKHKLEQISSTFLSDESSAIIQSKVPPKLRDPGSFLISCTFSKTFSCNALSDLGASINLMSYYVYAKLSLETLKLTKMSIRLAYRSFQYPVVIVENMLVEVGKFTFPVDFVILEMEEDRKVPLILEDLSYISQTQ
ncbi:reverse transcriptase domain-containing protein [Tanacetum coccineum]